MKEKKKRMERRRKKSRRQRRARKENVPWTKEKKSKIIERQNEKQ